MEEAFGTPTGELINRAFTFKAACESGFHLTLHDVLPDEFSTLQIIRAEIAALEAERQEEAARQKHGFGNRQR